jgi:catechol 2,3-dioxygenase-like lactoylglutathione lyase family enzyme
MPKVDERPPVWIGHIFLAAIDVEKSAAFMRKLGMRDIFQSESIVVLELRGGTHLLLEPTDDSVTSGTKAPFDLMVDDIDASHEEFEDLGLSPSTIEEDRFHRWFTILDPSGYEITVNSCHVSNLPV